MKIEQYKFRGKSERTGELVVGSLSMLNGPRIISEQNGLVQMIAVCPDSVVPYIGKCALCMSDLFLGDVLQDPETLTFFEIVWLEDEASFALQEIGTDKVWTISSFLTSRKNVLNLELLPSKLL